MKQFLLPIWILLFVTFSSNDLVAQFITKRSGQFGLVDTEGQVLIINECDSIFQVRNEFRALPAYVASKDGKYGIFIPEISDEIEFLYDELENKGGYYFFRSGEKWGFLHESLEHNVGVVEPQFDSVYPIAELVGGFHKQDADLHYRTKRVGIIQNDLHGIASYETGHILRECKYNGKIELVKGAGFSDYYKSIDKSDPEYPITILNDSTTVDFVFSFNTKVEVLKSHSLLIAVSPINNDSLFSITVANCYTGDPIVYLEAKWNSKTDYLSEHNWSLLNDEVMVIHEERTLDNSKSTQLRNAKCFNFKTGELLYESGMGEFARLASRKIDDTETLLYMHPSNKKYAVKNEIPVAKMSTETRALNFDKQ